MSIRSPTPSPDAGLLSRQSSFQAAQPSGSLDLPLPHVSATPGSAPFPSQDSSSSEKAKPLIRPSTPYLDEPILPNCKKFSFKELTQLYGEWSYRLEEKRRKNEIAVEKIRKLAEGLEKTFSEENQQLLGRSIRGYQIAEIECEQIEEDCDLIEKQMTQLQEDNTSLKDLSTINLDRLAPYQCKKLHKLVTERLRLIPQEVENERSKLRDLMDKKHEHGLKKTKKNDGSSRVVEVLEQDSKACSARMDALVKEQTDLRQLNETLSKSTIMTSVAYRVVFQDLIPQLRIFTGNLRFH